MLKNKAPVIVCSGSPLVREKPLGAPVFAKLVYWIWWLCLIPTSTTRFASDLWYRMTKKSIVLYKENTFYEQWHQIPIYKMKTTISSQKSWRPFWFACHSYYLDTNMCGFWCIRILVWTHTLVVTWQNSYWHIIYHESRYICICLGCVPSKIAITQPTFVVHCPCQLPNRFESVYILSCSVQNFKTKRQLKWMLRANEISRDLSSSCILDGYCIFITLTS